MAHSGGAGKVYFVLYLAVVLELLIIIVERDEAEEGLHRKQKETMKIVESILSQLQSGAGTEGINARPQDEITIPPPGVNIKEILNTEIKSFRKYIVEVGVTDITQDLKRKEGENDKDYSTRLKKLVELGNVEEIEYQVFYNSSQDVNSPPTFPMEDEIRKKNYEFTKFQPGQMIESANGDKWEFRSIRKLRLDKNTTYNNLNLANLTIESIDPVYPKSPDFLNTVGPSFIPKDMIEDSAFYYSADESLRKTRSVGDMELKKRSFIVNFQPPSEAGWFKLRFYSRTNRILGVRSDVPAAELEDDMTVNIGTVQLTVKDLQKVRRELLIKLSEYNLPQQEILTEEKDLEKFNQMLRKSIDLASPQTDAVEIISKIRLYGYIAKLLAPGQSINFSQNLQSLEYNIRVITPKPPPLSNPLVSINAEINRFDEAVPVFKFTISPWQGNNDIKATVTDINDNEVANANVRIQPMEETGTMTGGSRDYYGYIDSKLPAGSGGSPRQYKIKLKHSLGTKSADSTSILTIYPAKVEDNIKNLSNRFSATAYYGNKLFFTFSPPSGNKISPADFCIYYKTDADKQERSCKPGVTVSVVDNFDFPSDAKTATLRIVWNDPILKTPISIFPETTVDIKQTIPEMNPNQYSINISGTEDRPRVRISNIKVLPAEIGSSDPTKKSEVIFNVDNVNIRISGYKLSGKPKITNVGDNYTIEFDIVGALPSDAESLLKGDIELILSAVGRNPENGKLSNKDPRKFTVRVSKRFDQE